MGESLAETFGVKTRRRERVLIGETRSAEFSLDGRHRYGLGRRWGQRHGHWLWIMLNPSVANWDDNDRTIEQVCLFTRREGCDEARVVNLYSLVSTDPKVLLTAPDPIDNITDHAIDFELFDMACERVVCAWGVNAPHDRSVEVLRRVRRRFQPWCLGTTKNGMPKHPCRLAHATPLEPMP